MNTNLTVLENMSFVAETARALAQLNEVRHPIVAIPASRFAGLITLPFAGLADACTHALFATGKIAIGIIISPYNTFTVTLLPNMTAPIDLEISSGLVHIARIIQGLMDGILLPFICLLNPDRVHKMTSHRLRQDVSARREGLDRQGEEQDREILELTHRLRQLEEVRADVIPPLQNTPPPPPPLPSQSIEHCHSQTGGTDHQRDFIDLPKVKKDSENAVHHTSLKLKSCHEALLRDCLKFRLFIRSKHKFDEFMLNLEALEACEDYSDKEELVESILSDSLVKDAGLMKGKKILEQGDVKFLLAYFNLFKEKVQEKKLDDKNQQAIERKRQEDQEAAKIDQQLPKPVITDSKETLLCEMQKTLLEKLAIKKGIKSQTYDLQAAVHSLSTFKNGRLRQVFMIANERLHQKDRFEDLETFVAKYHERIAAINSAQDLNSLKELEQSTVEVIFNAIKKDL